MKMRMRSNISLAVMIVCVQGGRAETLLETVQRLSDTVEKLKSQCAPTNNVTFAPGMVRMWGKAGKEVVIVGDTAERVGGEAWFYAPDGKLTVNVGNGPYGGYERFYN